LEARVGELESTQFSTTTKLKGVATFVIGANSYGGDAKQYGGQTTRAEGASQAAGATTFNYDFLLYLTTSFTGRDLLQTVLHANNFQKSAFSGNPYVGLDALATAFQSPPEANNIVVSSLFYKFDIGEDLTFAAGPLIRQDDILAVWPSTYPSDPILQVFTYAGSPATYNKTLGSGVGAYWEKNNFSISGSYISTNAEKSSPDKRKNDPIVNAKLPLDGSNCEKSGGILTNCAASNSTIQIAYSPENWGVAAAYTYSSGANAKGATELGAGIYQGSGTFLANVMSKAGNANSIALSAWWTPIEKNWVPSISTGWGYSSIKPEGGNINYRGGDKIFRNYSVESAFLQSWFVGLEWENAFLTGNTLGMAIGQPTFVTSVKSEKNYFVADGNYAWELWYSFAVTDNITVTPAIYYLSRQAGDVTDGNRTFLLGGSPNYSSTFNNFGGLLKTTFKF
jgi:hypothetical protein